MKHTPGPWTIWKLDQEIIKGPDDKSIAYVQTRYRNAEAIEANARLIAAASDMYLALQQAKTRLEIAELNDSTLDMIKSVLNSLEAQ